MMHDTKIQFFVFFKLNFSLTLAVGDKRVKMGKSLPQFLWTGNCTVITS